MGVGVTPVASVIIFVIFILFYLFFMCLFTTVKQFNKHLVLYYLPNRYSTVLYFY